MPFSRTRVGDHGVLTDCSERTATGLYIGGQPGELGIARGTSRSAAPGLGTKSLGVQLVAACLMRTRAGKMQNVCADSSAVGRRFVLQTGVAEFSTDVRWS